jgi:hypothetical protein
VIRISAPPNLASAKCVGDKTMNTYEDMDYAPDDLTAEEIEVGYLFASCLSGWRGSGMFFLDDIDDQNEAEEKLRRQHSAACGCSELWID